MRSYLINRQFNGYQGTVRADEYRVEGDYFIFTREIDGDSVDVLVVKTSTVTTVELVEDSAGDP